MGEGSLSQKFFLVIPEKIESEMGRKRFKKLKFWQNVSLVYAPIFAVGFMTVYWIAGLKHADIL